MMNNQLANIEQNEAKSSSSQQNIEIKESTFHKYLNGCSLIKKVQQNKTFVAKLLWYDCFYCSFIL